jgi:hypothetical protein
MSDAFTDCARDNQRAVKYDLYLNGLLEYLKQPSDKKYKKLKKLAEDTDSVNGGIFSENTELSKNLEETVNKLKKGGKTEWLKFLKMFNDSPKTSKGMYRKFKEISPFKNSMIIFADYSDSFKPCTIRTLGLEEAILEKLDMNNYQTYDYDKYALIMEQGQTLYQSKIFWLESGVPNAKGPRDKRGEPKNDAPRPKGRGIIT